LLCGCAVDPKNSTAFTGALNSVFALKESATGLDQSLAEDFVKHSAELEYLSRWGKGVGQTCRDNDDPIIKTLGNVTAKSIKKQEDALLKVRLAELFLIQKYSEALSGYAEARADRAQHVAEILGLADSINATAFVPPEGKLVAATAKAVGAAFIAMDQNITNLKIQKAALKMQPTLVKMVGNLKRNFHVLGDRTQLYLNAWKSCAEEKFRFMRDTPSPSPRSTIVELQSAYSSYQAQYRTYINSLPQLGDDLDKIVKANQALIDTDSAELVTSAQQLSTTVNTVVSAYQSVKELPTKMSSVR
jgi:hypothetical protein